MDFPSQGATSSASGCSALCEVDDFVTRTYDYLIVGGGTAGLVLANRLSEDAEVHVGVIEAGPPKLNDPMILTPGLATQGMYHPESNWMMKSVPQVHSGNRVHDVPRGKLLGGSSAINYMMYSRGQKIDYDDWEMLGHERWGWSGILPYMLKHEHFDGLDSHYSHDDRFHGTSGGIHTSFPTYRCEIEGPWMRACEDALEKAHTPPKDAWSGLHTGVYTSLCTIDQSSDKGTRSYATTGYLIPILGRSNLKILTDSQVSRLILETRSDKVRAVGAEFLNGERTHKALASREVILSAGSVLTPQILELSGIGDPAILTKAGVKTVVENRDVGANFQDHLLTGVTYNLKPGIASLDALHDPQHQAEAIADYTTSQSGPLSNGQTSMGFLSYPSIATKSRVEDVASLITSQNIIGAKQAQLEADRLRSLDSAGIHIYGVAATFNLDQGHDCSKYFAPPPPGANRFTMGVSLQYPSSRGSVHIKSSNPLEQPNIDQAYLSHPADLAVLCDAVRYAEKCFQVPCLKEKVAERQVPPPSVDLNDQAQLENHVRTHTNTEYHLIGTAAMGKVVDDRVRVHGVGGLRVCDASVFPGNVSGNLVATVYAVAEKCADLIKEDWR